MPQEPTPISHALVRRAEKGNAQSSAAPDPVRGPVTLIPMALEEEPPPVRPSVTLSCRVTADKYEVLRRLAFAKRKTQQDLLREAFDMLLAKYNVG